MDKCIHDRKHLHADRHTLHNVLRRGAQLSGLLMKLTKVPDACTSKNACVQSGFGNGID